MQKYIISLIIVLIFIKCNTGKRESPPLTDAEKELIERFAVRLTKSINEYKYDLIKGSWDNSLFKDRVKLRSSELSVFNYFFEKDFASYLINFNVELVNRLKFNNGEIFLSKISHYNSHTEITYSMIFADYVDFWRYRIELKNNKPRLSDIYLFKNNIWESKNMKNIMRLNSKYTASSNERREANNAIQNSDSHLRYGDTLSALEYLYDIPSTHIIGNNLSLKKIKLASSISDSIFSTVLFTEYESNKTLYIDYLYHYYFQDTIETNKVYDRLSVETGEENLVDSLKSGKYMWN